MPLGGGHRNIRELFAAARAAEHQPAAAHVSSSCKFGREEKLPPKNVQQGFDIFRRGDAAEQNDFAVCSESLGEQACIALERDAVSRVGQRNRGSRDIAELFSGEQCFAWKQTAAGGNDQDSVHVGGSLGEGFRVSEFAAEVEATDKGKRFTESQAAVAEPHCQREASFFAQHQLGPNAAGIGRRKQEDAMDRRFFALRTPSFS